MDRSSSTIIIAVSSSILSLIIAVIIGTYFIHGEEAIGIGFIWIFSLPLIIVFSSESAHFFRNYLNNKNIRLRTVFCVGIIIGVTLIAPFLTYAVLKLIKL
jgi:hypothetical protein